MDLAVFFLLLVAVPSPILSDTTTSKLQADTPMGLYAIYKGVSLAILAKFVSVQLHITVDHSVCSAGEEIN